MKYNYTVNPILTGLALAFTNGVMIADMVLPRVPVDSVLYKYWRWDFGQFITVPDTTIGRKSPPNEVEFNATEVPASTKDYGLQVKIPVADLERAPDGGARLSQTEVLGTTNLILLDREVRVANSVLNLANYPAANKMTLSGTSQWSDYANSNPVNEIMTKLDTLVMRPKKLVMGRACYTQLRQNPKVLAGVFSTGGNVTATGGGMASKQAIADLLELDDIIVGEGFVNVAKEGQAVNMQRVWGKDCLAFYQDPISLSGVTQSAATFGFTAEFQKRMVMEYFMPEVGVKGVNAYKVVEQLGEQICAPELAYLWKNAVA